jgi:threonine dehydratase
MATLDADMIRWAAGHIDPLYLDTPLARHADLDAALGCATAAKVETLNPIRSFKGRGADVFVATQLRPGEAVVCASAGNFGQGIARAARRRGHPCTVFAATGANPRKVAAMRSFGAEVILFGADFDAAKLAARQAAGRSGARFVEDGAEPSIAAGAGTIGLELAAADPSLDAILVPLGNGALLAGIGTALREAAPGAEIIGVVAANAPSMKLSLDSGALVETETADSIADGVAVRTPVPEALAMLQGRYDRVIGVPEDRIIPAMKLIIETLGLVIEPAGALGVAAVMADKARFSGRSVTTILCGANLSQAMLEDLFGGGRRDEL